MQTILTWTDKRGAEGDVAFIMLRHRGRSGRSARQQQHSDTEIHITFKEQKSRRQQQLCDWKVETEPERTEANETLLLEMMTMMMKTTKNKRWEWWCRQKCHWWWWSRWRRHKRAQTVTCWKRPPVWKTLQGEAFPSVSSRVAWLAGWSVSWVGKQEGGGVSTAGKEEEETALSAVWKSSTLVHEF